MSELMDECCCDSVHTLQPCGPCRFEDHTDCAMPSPSIAVPLRYRIKSE